MWCALVGWIFDKSAGERQNFDIYSWALQSSLVRDMRAFKRGYMVDREDIDVTGHQRVVKCQVGERGLTAIMAIHDTTLVP